MTQQRLKIRVFGIVQGVGFRPFVFRLANSCMIKGFVKNNSDCVLIEAEGDKKNLEVFLKKLKVESPPASYIRKLDVETLNVTGYQDFKILPSDGKEKRDIVIPPDIAICDDCRRELLDPEDRRYYYPFINCTNCGPRYTIIQDLPYDRPKTTMKEFEMCKECREEYENPFDRRFHAQPNACSICGPGIELCGPSGCKTDSSSLISEIADILKAGEIVAIKGLGGFHLSCDARNHRAVTRLRKIKGRRSKPFAIMVPDIEWARRIAIISPLEERLLKSWQAPIVLLKLRGNNPISEEISPGLDTVGVMLPYTPLHLLILKEFDGPLVMTSGNVSDNPIIHRNDEVLSTFRGKIKFFVLHNRKIHMRIDDSIARVVKGRIQILRRARGYVPLPINISLKNSIRVLALGPLLKNTFTYLADGRAYMSQYIGDLDSFLNIEYLEEVLLHFSHLFGIKPDVVACDMHPDYPTTHLAEHLNLPIIKVQHHIAHVMSVVAEKSLFGKRVLGFSFDGTGYGMDGKIWGGEVFMGVPPDFKRVAHFKYFPLPTGEAAIKNPWRITAAFVKKIHGKLIPWSPDLPGELEEFEKVMNFNSVETSSAGRLFDAFASLLGLRHRVDYEAQAAMELESIAIDTNDFYAIKLEENGEILIDSYDFFEKVYTDFKRGLGIPLISSKIHNTFVWIIEEIKKRFRGEYDAVVYSGGVFQNRYILEKLDGFFNEEVPINDGGVSLGQAVYAAMKMGG